MDKMPKRDEMRETAYEWCIENAPQFFELFNRTTLAEDANIDYHGMVDGIVWSDELPERSLVNLRTLQQVFCILVHTRTSQILGQIVPPVGLKLMKMVREECPHWCFNYPDRNSASRRSDYERVRKSFLDKLDRFGNSLNDVPGTDH